MAKLAFKKRVSQGKMFGSDIWYVYYCGHCGMQVFRDDRKCYACRRVFEDEIRGFDKTVT